MDAAALLRTFEPILRFNERENYLPMRVEPYLARAALYRTAPFWRSRLVKTAPLTLADLNAVSKDARDFYFLCFVSRLALTPEPSRRDDWYHDPPPHIPTFQRTLDVLAGSIILGLALGGFFEAVWALLGSLPIGDVAAGFNIVQKMSNAERTPTYYGRILADQKFVTLQYWFFYAMNDWRSNSLGLGVNDHEGDWEHVDVILRQSGATYSPEYIAASAHNSQGAQLTRLWTEVEKADMHPIIYVGNGSHANYFHAGVTRVAEIDVGLRPDLWLARLKAWWQKTLSTLTTNRTIFAFADFAMGDGKSVGAGQHLDWANPVVLDEVNGIDEWGAVKMFPGLWGQYVHDFTGRENGPPGPPFTYTRFFLSQELAPEKISWTQPTEWAGVESIKDKSVGKS